MFSLKINNTQIEELENVKVTLNSGRFDFVVMALPDSGSNLNAISVDDLEFLGENEHNLIDAKFSPTAADGHKIKAVGRLNDVQITIDDRTISETFFVLKNLEKPILSRNVLKRLNLIPKNFPFAKVSQMDGKQDIHKEGKNKTKEEKSYSQSDEKFEILRKKYPRVFDGQCKIMSGEEAHIDVDPNATPVASGAFRQIPEPLMPAVKKELDALLEQGIIERVEHATPWIHPLVVVPKKDTSEVRICADPSRLNQHVRKPISSSAPPWEKVRKIPQGMKYFSVFDALKGYYQVALDEASKDLTAFLTPFGRFRYLRLPMGFSCSSDIFDIHYGRCVDGLENCERVCEDILIYGKTEKEFLKSCEDFFKICDENDITLNLRKVQWMKKEVLFAGYVISETGYSIDPKLSEALRDFPRPENITDMRSFFGLANQTCHFSDEIADALAPLKPLLKKGNIFIWLPEHQTAFEKARSILSSKKTLAYYHPNRATRLYVDASRLNGLGFVLKQMNDNGIWQTVQAGSRFLSEAETRYAMVELELLAIVWASQKSRMFVEGLPRERFTIYTDHQPLLPIVTKYSLPQISNKRLQRLRMKLDHLTFRLEWISGKLNVESDALSRAPVAKATKEDQIDEFEDSESDRTAKLVLSSTEMSLNGEVDLDNRLKEIRDAAKNDAEYDELSKVIRDGFPNAKTATSSTMRSFWHARFDLRFDEDEFIVYKSRLFIPKDLRTTLLKRLLAMHQGNAKMCARAEKSFWWPNMKKDVKNISLSCKPCQEYKRSNSPEKHLMHDIPVYPFQVMHADFCQYSGRHFLVAVDQFSGYPFVMQFSADPTSDMLIDTLMAIFSQFAIPEKIYSDGGPQFKAEKFQNFCKRWGIQQKISSPHFPRSNGIAENSVREMKKLIRGAFNHSTGKVIDEDFSAGILLFRNTPCTPTDKSPAEILFGRQLRDNLPTSRQLLRPNLRFDVESRRLEAQQKQAKYSPKKELPLLQPGARVFVQHPATKRWTDEGSIISFANNEREYLIRMDSNDRILRRNRHFLRPQYVPTSNPPRQPVLPPSSTTSGPENPRSSPAKRTYAEVAREVSGEVETERNVRPKRDIKKPVRFNDKNFVYK